jgi:hypothetical protein
LIAQSAIVATQPDCAGTAVEPLWDGGRVRTVVRWLPDLFTHVVRGDLGIGGYLRAGHVCQPLALEQPYPGAGQDPVRLDIPRDGGGSLAVRIVNAAASQQTVSEERLPAWSLSLEQQQRLLDAADRSRDAVLAEWSEIAVGSADGVGPREATEEEVERLVEALRRSSATDFGIATALPDLDAELPGQRIGWYRERAYQAWREALATNKNMIMVIGEDWCDHCNDLVENVLRCPEVERFAGRALFAYGRPSREANSAQVARDLGVTEYPAIFLLEPHEDIIYSKHEIVGSVEASELAAKLREFLGDPSSSVGDASAAARTPGFHAEPQPLCR